MNEATTNANAEVDTIASLPLLQDNEVEVLLQKMKSEDTNICHHVSIMESLVSPTMEEDDGSLSSSSEEDGSLCSSIIGEDFFHIEDNKIINVNSHESDTDELWNRYHNDLAVSIQVSCVYE